MSLETLKLSRAGVAVAPATNVEFCEGFAESLPLPDKFAAVVISNGALNVTLDETEPLREWFRILKPGGRLQWATFLSSARRQMAHWTTSRSGIDDGHRAAILIRRGAFECSRNISNLTFKSKENKPCTITLPKSR